MEEEGLGLRGRVDGAEEGAQFKSVFPPGCGGGAGCEEGGGGGEGAVGGEDGGY